MPRHSINSPSRSNPLISGVQEHESQPLHPSTAEGKRNDAALPPIPDQPADGISINDVPGTMSLSTKELAALDMSSTELHQDAFSSDDYFSQTLESFDHSHDIDRTIGTYCHRTKHLQVSLGNTMTTDMQRRRRRRTEWLRRFHHTHLPIPIQAIIDGDGSAPISPEQLRL